MVARMLQQLAEQQAQRYQLITALIASSKGGTPKAQQKLAARLEQAGALFVGLKRGKRGKFTLSFLELLGWDPDQDRLISPKLPGPRPEKPWLACYANLLEGRGTHTKHSLLVLITHHVLSRAAQRFGDRTPDDLIKTAKIIAIAAGKLADKNGLQQAIDRVPPDGHRIQVECELTVGTYAVTVVLTRHDKRPALVALTMF